MDVVVLEPQRLLERLPTNILQTDLDMLENVPQNRDGRNMMERKEMTKCTMRKIENQEGELSEGEMTLTPIKACLDTINE